MSPERLLRHFERISEAPDAIPRLRRFILDLAVRGKLVEQDLNDEPASSLLMRINAETKRLVQAGEMKPPPLFPPLESEDLPFQIPFSWEWTRLGVVACCLDSRRAPVNIEERTKRIEGKRPDELYPYYGATQQQGWIDDFLFDEELVLLGEDGAPFDDPLRPKAYLVSGKSWVNNHAHVFRGILMSNQFLVHWLNAFDYASRVAGATRAKLNQSKAIDIPLAVPPLAEQHRIVAKVDELMTLCNELEDAQAKRERRRDRLVVATLHGLSNGDASDAAVTFEQSARFYINHLSRLSTRSEHIQQLRKAILNLALRGKLVPQDPNDEPASDLLKRIAKEKHLRLSSGRTEQRKPNTPVNDEGLPFKLPPQWAWCRLGDIINLTSGQHLLPNEYSHDDQTGVPYITGPADFGEHGLVVTRYALVRKAIALEGQILLTVKGAGVGKTAVCDLPEVAISRQLMAVDTIEWNRRFLQLVIQLLATELKKKSRSLIPGISREDVCQFAIALPPTAEQHRIVAKVDELTALCDEMERELETTATVASQLLEAALHEALVG